MTPPNANSVDLAACLQGDASAWNDLVRATTGLVIAAVRRVVGPTPPPTLDVEDLVQQVYIRLLQNDMRMLRTYDPDRAALSTWITLVSRSTTIDALRRKRLPTVHVDAALQIPSTDRPPEAAESALNAIPFELLTDRQLVVLRMLYDDGLDVAQVASVLGVEPQTIRSTRHKAMERLRAHFSDLSSTNTSSSHALDERG